MQMTHPDIPNTKENPVSITKREFDSLYKGRGWEVHAPPVEKAAKKPTKKAEA